MKLFVARLSASITEDNLSELFSAFGEVLSTKIVMDRETGNSKGYGFIEMPNDEEANAAIAALNETELDGKNIVVKEANRITSYNVCYTKLLRISNIVGINVPQLEGRKSR